MVMWVVIGKVRICIQVGPTSKVMLLSFPQLQVIFTLLFPGPTGNMVVWQGQFHIQEVLTLLDMEMPGRWLCVRTSLLLGKELSCADIKSSLCYLFEEENSQWAFNNYPISFTFVLLMITDHVYLKYNFFLFPPMNDILYPNNFFFFFLLLRVSTRCKKNKNKQKITILL